MSSSVETLRISVQAAPSSNDHEVMLWADGDNLLSRIDGDAMGLDPSDVLVKPCPLLPAATPRSVLIGRCDCGVIGCGDAHAVIARADDVVTWSSNGQTVIARFDAPQYLAEVERALADHSWETPERTTARLIATTVDRALLARSGLTFSWASGRARPPAMTISLAAPGYQILVRVPWHGEPPPAIASTICDLLRTDPHSWPTVEWIAQAGAFAPPPMAGPGWHRAP